MSSAETARRKARAALIFSEGYVVMPCSFCSVKSLQCVMKEGHKNCSECTRRGRSCDGKGVSLSEGKHILLLMVVLALMCVADRLVQAKARLEADEEATEEELLELQRQLNERLSKLMRLRRQKRLLQSKGMKMLERDLQSVGELEAVEAAESSAAAESSLVVDSMAAGAVDLIDWSTVFGDPSSVDGSPSGVVGH
jgi:hypothetical protein